MLFCETISALSPLLTHGRFVMLGTQPVIFSTFENLPDPRVDGGNKRHSLVEIVIVTLCATICGAESWTDVERFEKRKLSGSRSFSSAKPESRPTTRLVGSLPLWILPPSTSAYKTGSSICSWNCGAKECISMEKQFGTASMRRQIERHCTWSAHGRTG